MATQQNVYNVIWVDDDVDQLSEDTKGVFRKLKVNIIGKAHTANEFYEIIHEKYDRVDAVIIDANFKSKETDFLTETSLGGLKNIDRNIRMYNDKRVIPFFLYTGRYDLLQNRDDEFIYFRENQRIFLKDDGILKLLEQLIKDVEHINSTEFLVRNRYNNELEAAKKIPGNEEDLFEALKYDFSKDIKTESTAAYFNVLRKVVERIFERCKEKKIIAPIKELNGWTRFLKNKHDYYEIIEDTEIMPQALTKSLKYLIDMTQDGSHSCNTNLSVDKYVRETGGINLFRTMLHITMDLCVWYKKYIEEHPNSLKNAALWRVKESYKYEHKGDVKSILVENTELYVSGEYLFDRELKNSFKPGDIIGIKKSTDNTHSIFKEYNVNGENIVLKKYVRNHDVVLIERKE